MNHIFFYSMVVLVLVLGTSIHCGGKKETICQGQSDSLGNILLGNLVYAIYMTITLTFDTYVNIFANQVHPFKKSVFSIDSGSIK